MPVNDALDQGQADPGAFKLLLAVQALKDAEKFAGMLGIEPGPVVLHVVDVFFGVALADVEDLLTILKNAFGNPNRRLNAERKLTTLR